jgi:hypothetical protein
MFVYHFRVVGRDGIPMSLVFPSQGLGPCPASRLLIPLVEPAEGPGLLRTGNGLPQDPGRAWPCPTSPPCFDSGKTKWHWDAILRRVANPPVLRQSGFSKLDYSTPHANTDRLGTVFGAQLVHGVLDVNFDRLL